MTQDSEIPGRMQTRAARRKDREQQHAVLQAAMDGFWLVDLRGRLLEVNAIYCQMSGYAEAELLTMSIADLEARETAEDAAAHIHTIMLQGRDRFESQHRRKDGSIFDVEVSAQYQPFNGGCYMAFLRDITHRRRTQEALTAEADFNQRVFNSTDAHLAVVGPGGKILSVNAAWQSFSENNAGNQATTCRPGADYFVQYQDEWGDTARAHEAFDGIRAVQNGQAPSFSLEYPCHGPGNVKRWFVMRVFPLQGRAGTVLVSHTDITKLKLAEEALYEYQSQLELKTSELRESNIALKVMLKQREDDKRELEEKIHANIRQLVFPHIETLKKNSSNRQDISQLNILTANLNDIISSFTIALSHKLYRLTQKELQVANLVKEGLQDKEISEMLRISITTVKAHRRNIRKKLEIKGEKINTRTFLSQLNNN